MLFKRRMNSKSRSSTTADFSFEKSQYRLLRSSPTGEVLIGVSQAAQKVLARAARIRAEELAPLPERVYDSCTALGVPTCAEPRHFLVEAPGTDHPLRGGESGMAIAELKPPLHLPTGEAINGGIFLFRSFAAALREIEEQMLYGFNLAGVTPGSPAEVAARESLRPALKTKCLLDFSHELVHMYFTDAFSRPNKGLRLAELEVLTDSLNLLTFIGDYKNCEPPVLWGVVAGFPYLANTFTRLSSIGSTELLLKMEGRAKKLVRAHKLQTAPFPCT